MRESFLRLSENLLIHNQVGPLFLSQTESYDAPSKFLPDPLPATKSKPIELNCILIRSLPISGMPYNGGRGSGDVGAEGGRQTAGAATAATAAAAEEARSSGGAAAAEPPGLLRLAYSAVVFFAGSPLLTLINTAVTLVVRWCWLTRVGESS